MKASIHGSGGEIHCGLATKRSKLYREKGQQGPRSTQVASSSDTRHIVDLFGRAATHMRQAAEKLEQACGLRLDPIYQEYISLEAQALRKSAQAADVRVKLAGSLMGKSNKEIERLRGLFESMVKEVNSLIAEAEELHARVKAIEAANPGVIKQDAGAGAA